MSRIVTFDTQGNDITCMKNFDILKDPCTECDVKNCEKNKQNKLKKEAKNAH